MNDKDHLNAEERALAEMLKAAADQVDASVSFQNELEKKLMNAHRPKAGFGLFSVKKAAVTIGWTVGFATLTLLFIWVIRSIAPQPQPAANSTPTPSANPDPTATEEFGGFDFRGGRLSLALPLPDAPANVYVFQMQNDPPATVEDALALAARFGIQGEVYAAKGRQPETTEYAVSDGKQWISVGTKNYFFYTADMVKNSRNFLSQPNDNAEAIIRDFLTARGFNFAFKVTQSDLYGGYLVHPLSPDGLPVRYEEFSTPIMRVVLDETGQVLSLDANLAVYDQTPVASPEIISAEEALQIAIDDTIIFGKIESMNAGNGAPPQQWFREYPNDTPVTIYANVTTAPAVDPSKPALLLIDNVPAVGNTSGFESLESYQYIKASGKYFTENGVRKFMVDAWESRNIELAFFSGSLRQEGGQVILTSDDGSGTETVMLDPPADIPLNTKVPESQLYIYGMLLDGKIDWTYIQFFADSSQMGGGGGGGGMGFYQINLSGTPVPFPTATPMPVPAIDENTLRYVVQEGDTLERIANSYGLTAEQLQQANGLSDPNITIGQSIAIPGTSAPPQLEGARGTVSVTIYTSEDGTQRAEYAFNSSDPQNPYMILEGENLEELQAFHNKPVKIWGAADRMSPYGVPVINVDKFEVVFPDLQFQILSGTEQAIQFEGNDVIIFTTEDGTQYAELAPNCADILIISGEKAEEGTTVNVEALAVPDLRIGDYPALCIFSSGGESVELEITADQPNIMPEITVGPFSTPKVTIDSVELVYYASNPNYQQFNPGATERVPYMQPAWHFHGFYESGQEINIFVQALKQEFLLPNTDPILGPG